MLRNIIREKCVTLFGFNLIGFRNKVVYGFERPAPKPAKLQVPVVVKQEAPKSAEAGDVGKILTSLETLLSKVEKPETRVPKAEVIKPEPIKKVEEHAVVTAIKEKNKEDETQSGFWKSFTPKFVMATAVMMVAYLVYDSQSYKGSPVGYRNADSNNASISTLPLESGVVAASSEALKSVSSMPVASFNGGYITADKSKVQEALTAYETRKAKLQKVRDELSSFGGFDYSEASQKADEIRKKAAKAVEERKKTAEAKAETLRKKGKNKEAEKVLARLEKGNTALLSKAEKDAKTVIAKSSQTAERIDQLLAEQQELQSDVQEKRAAEIKLPNPHVAAAPSVMANARKLFTAYYTNSSRAVLALKWMVGNEMKQVALKPGQILAFDYSGQRLALLDAATNETISEQEEFADGRRFITFLGGGELERSNEPSQKVRMIMKRRGEL